MIYLVNLFSLMYQIVVFCLQFLFIFKLMFLFPLDYIAWYVLLGYADEIFFIS